MLKNFDTETVEKCKKARYVINGLCKREKLLNFHQMIFIIKIYIVIRKSISRIH